MTSIYIYLKVPVCTEHFQTPDEQTHLHPRPAVPWLHKHRTARCSGDELRRFTISIISPVGRQKWLWLPPGSPLWGAAVWEGVAHRLSPSPRGIHHGSRSIRNTSRHFAPLKHRLTLHNSPYLSHWNERQCIVVCHLPMLAVTGILPEILYYYHHSLLQAAHQSDWHWSLHDALAIFKRPFATFAQPLTLTMMQTWRFWHFDSQRCWRSLMDYSAPDALFTDNSRSLSDHAIYLPSHTGNLTLLTLTSLPDSSLLLPPSPQRAGGSQTSPQPIEVTGDL